jgi:hypothetical protein
MVVPAEGVGSVMSTGRSVRRATPSIGATIAGASTAILEVGKVPIGGEIRQLARETVDAFQNLCIIRYLANARECRRGDGLGDTICAEGRSVQPGLGHTDESGFDVGG